MSRLTDYLDAVFEDPFDADKFINDALGGDSGSTNPTWRVPSGKWQGLTWSQLMAKLKAGSITVDEVAAIIQQSPPSVDGVQLGEQAILTDVKENLPESKTADNATAKNFGASGWAMVDKTTGQRISDFFGEKSEAEDAFESGGGLAGSVIRPPSLPGSAGGEFYQGAGFYEGGDLLTAARPGKDPNGNPTAPAVSVQQAMNTLIRSGMPADQALKRLQNAGILTPTSTLDGIAKLGASTNVTAPTGMQDVPQELLGQLDVATPAQGQTAPTGKPMPQFTPGSEEERRANFIAARYQDALRWSAQTGIPPEVYVAIGASESNFGAAANVLFGMKGSGDAGTKSYATHEVINGQTVYMDDNFASYSSPDAAHQAFVDLISTAPRYASAWADYQSTGDWKQLLQGINSAGYATDPNWANMIAGLADNVAGGAYTGGVAPSELAGVEPGLTPGAGGLQAVGQGTQEQQFAKEQNMAAFRAGEYGTGPEAEAEFRRREAVIDAQIKQEANANAAAQYDAENEAANAALDAWAAQTGVRVFKDASKPGTGFYYDPSGKLVPVAYVAQRGRVETGVSVSGNNVATGPGGFSAITNPGQARAVSDSATFGTATGKEPSAAQAALNEMNGAPAGGIATSRTTSLGTVSAADAAEVAIMDPGQRAQAIAAMTGQNLDAATENAFFGTSVAGSGAQLADQAVQRGQEGNVYGNNYARLIASGMSPDEASYLANVRSEAAKSATAQLGEPQNATSFRGGQYYDQNGQPIEREGMPPELRAAEIARAQNQAASRGIRLTPSKRGFQFVDGEGNYLPIGAEQGYADPERAWAEYYRWLKRQEEIKLDAKNNFDDLPVIRASAAQNRSINNLGSSAFGGNPNQPSSAYPGPRPQPTSPYGGNGGLVQQPQQPTLPTPDPLVNTPLPTYNGPLKYQPEPVLFAKGGMVGAGAGTGYTPTSTGFDTQEEIGLVGLKTGKMYGVAGEGPDGIGGMTARENITVTPGGMSPQTARAYDPLEDVILGREMALEKVKRVPYRLPVSI